MTVQNQVKPQQLQSIALPLEVAIKDILTCQISQAQSPRPVLGSQTPDRARTAAAESVEAAAAHTLQGMDSTAVAALFGCAGYLLCFQSKCLLKAALTEPDSNHASSAQQAERLARQAESAEVDGGKHNSVDDASDTMVASGLPWVLSSLTQQVAWLTDVLQLPWQLVPGKGLGLSGRWYSCQIFECVYDSALCNLYAPQTLSVHFSQVACRLYCSLTNAVFSGVSLMLLICISSPQNIQWGPHTCKLLV